LHFGALYGKTVDQLERERAKRVRRVDLRKNIHLPPPGGTQLNAYQQLYPEAVAEVFERWVRMLRRVENVLLEERKMRV
jgi:hypothetical protein